MKRCSILIRFGYFSLFLFITFCPVTALEFDTFEGIDWLDADVEGQWSIRGGSQPGTTRQAYWSSFGGEPGSLEIEVASSYQKVSIAGAVSAITTIPSASTELTITVNGTTVNTITLSGGDALDSSYMKEIPFSVDLSSIVRGDGTDTINFTAVGTADIAISRIYYGNYPFCTVKGSVNIVKGESWSLVKGMFSTIGVNSVCWRDGDYCSRIVHSSVEAAAVPFQYSITGIPADLSPYQISLDFTGYQTSTLSNVVLNPGQTLEHTFDVTVKDHCDAIEYICRPCSSIPEIVIWHDTLLPARFYIYLKNVDLSASNFNVKLASDHWERDLRLRSVEYGNFIYNEVNPGNPTYGCRLTVDLGAEKNYPEELYALYVSWNQDELDYSDMTHRSVKVINSYYNSIANSGSPVDWYFVQISDAHTTESIINNRFDGLVDTLNLINPAFVISTGDNWEGGLNWAVNALAWNNKLTEDGIQMPVYVCPGNHEYQPLQKNVSVEDRIMHQTVKQGWLQYNSQNMYEFKYGPNIFICGDDNLLKDESGVMIGDEELEDYMLASHVTWLNERFNEIWRMTKRPLVMTFSHQFNTCCNNYVDVSDICYLGGPYDPPGMSWDHSWATVNHFGDFDSPEDNLVTLHMSGHAHGLCCLYPDFDTPYLTSANIANYSIDHYLGIHYFSSNRNVKEIYADLWNGYDKHNDEYMMVKVDDLEMYKHAIDPQYPYNRQATIINHCEWQIPTARVRFEVEIEFGKDRQWIIDESVTTTAAVIDQIYTSDDMTKAIIDVDAYIPGKPELSEQVLKIIGIALVND